MWVHFGGTLYSMCDPFYMFILLEKLKKDHIIWDRAATVEFVKPGKGTVTAVLKFQKRQLKVSKKRHFSNLSQTTCLELKLWTLKIRLLHGLKR